MKWIRIFGYMLWLVTVLGLVLAVFRSGSAGVKAVLLLLAILMTVYLAGMELLLYRQMCIRDRSEETLTYIMGEMFPDMKEKAKEQWIGLFLDLQLKAENAEISTKSLDLRGLIAAARTVRQGLKPALAVQMGIINKCFDIFEKEIVRDVVCLLYTSRCV